MRIGIDIGNVIIAGGGTDTQFFGDGWSQTPEVPGAFDSIKALQQAGHELHVISKCGKATELRSVTWMSNKGYFPWVFLEHRVHFVRKRPLKAPMAVALELDIFIDDMEDVIAEMLGVVKHPILFTSWEQANAELERIFNGKA